MKRLQTVLTIGLAVTLLTGCVDVKKAVVTEEKTTAQEVCDIIQNIDDDKLIKAVDILELPEGYGDGEQSYVKRYSEGRIMANDEARKNALVNVYGQTLTVSNIDVDNPDTSKTAIQALSSNKPKVIMRASTTCPSCHKMLDNIGDIANHQEFDFIMVIPKEKLAKKDISVVPEELRKFVIVTTDNADFGVGIKRYPSTIFLTADNKVFDLGGCVATDAIAQKIGDIPNFDKDYTLEDELRGDK